MRATLAPAGNVLRRPPDWSAWKLTVGKARAVVWPRSLTDELTINGSIPGPTIRVRLGEGLAARVVNWLDQPFMLHWHGALAPDRMDGHHRDAVQAAKPTT
ncbi:MAG: multicopper oxidase domain-containing protein [Verrucomicrobiales bacterium]|nr:multicopper oxidase domain-containing protein [Verrucomicrobiales bacterium]